MSRTLRRATDDGALARLASHVRTPLFGGAYALLFSSASTAALGLLYWALAARLYHSSDVGVNAAAISTMTFLSYLAQLNLAGVLVRFIPIAGPRTGRLVAASYGAAIGLSGLVAVAFVLGVARLTSPEITLLGDPLGAIWFVLATMSWSVFALQDAALTGLRRTFWVPVENTVFAIAKILLLVVLVSRLENAGIFASWTVPALLLLVPVNLAIFRRFVPRHAQHAARSTDEVRLSAILPYLAGDYLGSLMVYAIVGLLPLVVLSVLGADAAAYFYVPWTIAYSLQLMSVNIGTSLLVEGSARKERLGVDSRRMLLLLLRIQVPVTALIIVGAPLILQVFGSDYASGSVTLLRILVLAVIPHGVNVILLSQARVHRQMGRIVFVEGALASVALVLSLLLLDPMGITGAGVAWLVAQSVATGLLIATGTRAPWGTIAGPEVEATSDAGVGPEPPAAHAIATDTNGEVQEAASIPAVTPPVPAMPSLLTVVFRDLDADGARWSVLRGLPSDLALGARDVDILVRHGDRVRVASMLAAHGFVEVPGWGRGSSFYVGRDEREERWVYLDVATEVAFGRRSELAVEPADRALARRRTLEGVTTLDADDAFWILLLHCLLDKGRIPARHAMRLTSLVDDARTDGPIATAFGRHLPAGRDLMGVCAAVRAADWAGLEALGPDVAARWRRAYRFRVLARTVRSAALRAAGAVVMTPRRRGLSVALLGPDGAGKSTLSAAIEQGFALPVKPVYMGLWARSGGRRVPAVEIALRPFRIWSRYLSAFVATAAGRLVVFDRYTHDARIPPRGRFVGLKQVYFGLLAHTIPSPDLVLVLDAPGETLFRRKGEWDPERLDADRREFRAMAQRMENAELIDAGRPADAVYADAVARIWRLYVARVANRAVSPGLIGAVGRPIISAGVGLERKLDRVRDRALARRTFRRALAIPAVQGAADDADRAARRIHTTSTGVTIAEIGNGQGPGPLIVKIAASEESGSALAANRTTIATLAADPRLDGWSQLLPAIVDAGTVDGAAYLVESRLPGMPARRLLRDREARRHLLLEASRVISGLHQRTAGSLTVGPAEVDAWVVSPVGALLAGLRSHDADAPFATLREALAERLSERKVMAGWIHGDYWVGNLLVSPDGARITGIVDWDHAAPGQLPSQDLFHLLLYARSLRERRELGEIVRAILWGPRLDRVEQEVLDAAAFPTPTREDLRLWTVLAWLWHVSSVASTPGHGSSGRWVRRNVLDVVRDAIGPAGLA